MRSALFGWLALSSVFFDGQMRIKTKTRYVLFGSVAFCSVLFRSASFTCVALHSDVGTINERLRYGSCNEEEIRY